MTHRKDSLTSEAHEIAALLWRYYLLPLPPQEKERVKNYFAERQRPWYRKPRPIKDNPRS